MRVAELSPINGARFKVGKTYKASSWTAVDTIYSYHFNCREIYHYSTLMGRFVDTGSGFGFEPISTGWGSVSDQKGMNQIMRDTGWYFSRKGGAEYIDINTRK